MRMIIAIALAALVLALPVFASAEAAPEKDTGTLSVQGQASVFVDPDTASVSLGVEITKDDAKDAQAEVNKVINATNDALLKLEIPAEKIQTEVINVNPSYNYDDGERKLIGYTAFTTITVKLDKIDMVGQVIDAAMESGANNINGVTFSTSKHNEIYYKALEAAVQNARQKANIMAAADGSSIVSVSSITENYSNGLNSAKATAEYAAMDRGVNSSMSTTVSAGQIEIDASVSVTYKIAGE